MLKDDLRPRSVWGTFGDNEMLFDEELMSESDTCPDEWELGVGFKAEHVGLLRQVKWFLKDLQGSN